MVELRALALVDRHGEHSLAAWKLSEGVAYDGAVFPSGEHRANPVRFMDEDPDVPIHESQVVSVFAKKDRASVPLGLVTARTPRLGRALSQRGLDGRVQPRNAEVPFPVRGEDPYPVEPGEHVSQEFVAPLAPLRALCEAIEVARAPRSRPG